MDIFLTSHEFASALGLWFLASVMAVFIAYITARSCWKALAPHMGARLAAILTGVWYLFWVAFFTYFVAVLIDAVLIDIGVGEDQAFLLMQVYASYGYVILALCTVVGGLLFYRTRKAAVPQALSWWSTLWHIVRMPVGMFVLLFAALVLIRIPAVGSAKNTAAAVAHIQAQKITLADVMGAHLPPQPYEPANDATVAGIDKNNNGIRDDVELAIFAKYPNSAKIRAAELQYAMTEQMFLTDVNNTDTWKAVAEEDTRAYNCISLTYPRTNMDKYIQVTDGYSNEVEAWVFNTQARKDAKDKAFDFITGHGAASGNVCDIDLNSLPN